MSLNLFSEFRLCLFFSLVFATLLSMFTALSCRPLAKPKKHFEQQLWMASATASPAAAAKYNFRFGYWRRVCTTAIIIWAGSAPLERSSNSRICKLAFRIKFIHRILQQSTLQFYSTLCTALAAAHYTRKNGEYRIAITAKVSQRVGNRGSKSGAKKGFDSRASVSGLRIQEFDVREDVSLCN